MAYQTIPPSSSGSGTTVAAATALSRAQSLLGTTITKVFGTDFDTTSWITSTLAGLGTATLSVTDRGGVMRLQAGANAGGAAYVRPIGAGAAAGGLIINPTTERWYCRVKAKVVTAVDGNALVLPIYVGDPNGGNPTLFIGVNGSRSAANFTYDFFNNAGGAAGNGSLSVAIDTNYHVFEALGDTTNFYVYIDGTQRLSLAIPATITSPCTLFIYSGNGATAANRELAADEAHVCTAA